MKFIPSICVMLALCVTAFGQQADRERQTLSQRLNTSQTEGEEARQANGTSAQVVVQLQIIKVSLTKLRQLGFDLTKLPGGSDAKSDIDPANGNALTFSAVNDGSEAQLILKKLLFLKLRKDNLVKVLAEPTLTTLSGKTTVFNCGDKLPIPKPQQDDSVAIEHQNAVVVELTPEVLGDTVHLAIHGRLAELDYGHMVRIGRQTLPGVRTREFTTRTELKSSQTLMIRGLTESRVEAINRGLPYVSEVPYVGAIFRRVEEQSNEIATLILVRPEIVQSSATATARQPADGDTQR